MDDKHKNILKALCDSYRDCNKFAKYSDEDTSHTFFHLRDFVYLMRYLRAACTSGDTVVLSSHSLLRGLQRNFNGIQAHQFEKLVEFFFTNVNKKLEAFGEYWEIPDNLHTDTFVELIRDRCVTSEIIAAELIL